MPDFQIRRHITIFATCHVELSGLVESTKLLRLTICEPNILQYKPRHLQNSAEITGACPQCVNIPNRFNMQSAHVCRAVCDIHWGCLKRRRRQSRNSIAHVFNVYLGEFRGGGAPLVLGHGEQLRCHICAQWCSSADKNSNRRGNIPQNQPQKKQPICALSAFVLRVHKKC